MLVADHVAADQLHCLLPQAYPSCPLANLSFSPSPPVCQMVPQFGALLPLTVAVALQQMVGRLRCCADTDISAPEEGAPLLAVL